MAVLVLVEVSLQDHGANCILGADGKAANKCGTRL